MKELRYIYFILLLFPVALVYSQPSKILHYTETSGFDHQTRIVSYNMFLQMGMQNGFAVDNDSTGNVFNSFANLQQYDVIVFANTTGNAILDSAQQQHFMQYMNAGGNFIGIHSATDTYRHSTANGSNTGAWDWYAEMVGASVQENPNHVSGTPVYRIDALAVHPILNGMPNPWFKPEEYYYWEAGYFGASNNVLQQVEQTVGPNGLVNSYDSSRAVTWYKQLPNGGDVFYTSLGHAQANYTSDPDFYKLIENAVMWSSLTALNDNQENHLVKVFPTLFNNKVFVIANSYSFLYDISLYTTTGKLIYRNGDLTGSTDLELNKLHQGIYILEILYEKKLLRMKIVKQ
jgi:type 1 glutamine amidotransferase